MTKKNTSSKKKLLPAAGMLALSAAMLSSATFAWFTMSREVEVKNIQMTATVPEDIQISLGKINKSASDATDSIDFSLSKSTGWLTYTDGEATAPRGVTGGVAADYDELDWSNTADITAYYSFGKLIPASSTNGTNVFYTPDADGVGRTVKADAAYYQAVAGGTANKAGTSAATGITADTSAKATSHIYSTTEKTAADSHTWGARSTENSTGYKTATDYANTYDDGYYVDIPVWLRTSSTETQDIYVTGFVKEGSTTDDDDTDDVLYQAVRVAILKDDYSADGGCLNLADGAKVQTSGVATYYSTVAQQTADATKHILDSDIYNQRIDPAGTGINAHASAADACSAITQNDGTTAVCTLAAGTGTEYGTATKLIIRVWLEGEDGDCWNENAGQDWDISLKFMKTALS